MYCRGGAEESKGGDGDAAATIPHAAKRGDGEEEEDVDAAADSALPHVMVPMGAPSSYYSTAAASEARIAAAAPSSLREATRRRKMTATRLLHCRTRWRPCKRPECFRVAAPRRGRDTAATRLTRAQRTHVHFCPKH
jgi:hypothetical protein